MELTHEQRDEQRDLEQRQVLAAAREARSAGASRTIAAHRRRTHARTHAALWCCQCARARRAPTRRAANESPQRLVSLYAPAMSWDGKECLEGLGGSSRLARPRDGPDLHEYRPLPNGKKSLRVSIFLPSSHRSGLRCAGGRKACRSVEYSSTHSPRGKQRVGNAVQPRRARREYLNACGSGNRDSS
jgi:hypothetical protein